MAEPAWATFAGIVAFVTVGIVALARASQGVVTDGGESVMASDDGDGMVPDDGGDVMADDGDVMADDGDEADRRPAEQPSLSTGALLVNVAFSQGVLGSLLLLGAWYAEIPRAALGLAPETVGTAAAGLGLALGVALYAGDELLAAAADRAGVAYSEDLREALAPDTARGWLLLLGGVLPVIAGFEELLFRAALVGALAAGFGVSPWLLAVASSVVFGVAHGAQGPGGMAVTAALGFALAAAFVLTGSFVVVFVAHWLVNALEFGVHDGLGVEWPG
jgi:membrane protease YdiL (CAAX protease family)